MNKQELIAKVAKDLGATKSSAALAIDSVIDGITRALKKGDSVTFDTERGKKGMNAVNVKIA